MPNGLSPEGVCISIGAFEKEGTCMFSSFSFPQMVHEKSNIFIYIYMFRKITSHGIHIHSR
jgi:hypothetical protein